MRAVWRAVSWRVFAYGVVGAVGVALVACSFIQMRGNPAEPAPRYRAGDTLEELVIGRVVRQYRLHIPRGYEAGKPLPLVINLHGYSSNAAQQERESRMSIQADQAGFIAVYPEGLGSPQGWRVGGGQAGSVELQFFTELVGQLQSRLSIDAARIYAAGISNGAQMADRLGCEKSDIFAAIASVSGGYTGFERCQAPRPVPMIAFHGTADLIFPYEGKPPNLLPAREWAATRAARNGCNPAPAITFQRGEVKGETWSGCKQGADVAFYTIQGGGHRWPRSEIRDGMTMEDVDGSALIWEFFAAHQMP